MKLIDLHYQWLKNGKIPGWGLCYCLEHTEYKEVLDLFKPNNKELTKLDTLGLSTAYWGSGLSIWDEERDKSYTPLRQTIVLFICVIKNEI